MYKLTDTEKEAFNNSHKYAEIAFNGTAETRKITSGNIWGLELERTSVNGSQIAIGTFCAATLTVTLNNNDGEFDDLKFSGGEMFVTLKATDTEDNECTMPLGYFLVNEAPRKTRKITVDCYDRAVKFDITADFTGLTFPATLAEIASYGADICGVEIATDITALPNGKYTVQEAPDSSLTWRQVFMQIAEITASVCFINTDGKVAFGWYTDSGDSLTAGERYDHDLYEDDNEITGVLITDSEGYSYSAGTLAYPFEIDGNDLLQSDYEEVAKNIYAAIKGLVYRPFSATIISMPYIEPLDVLTYVEPSGATHNVIITSFTYKMNGKGTVEGVGKSALEQDLTELNWKDGTNGTDGQDGADGKSAYEIAVANGYTGTETEWLASLKGADGADGKDGTNGTDGQDGADGKDGADGVGIANIEVSSDGTTWTFTMTDGTTKNVEVSGSGGGDTDEDDKSGYTITFNANGGTYSGSGTTTKTTDSDGKVSLPANPTYSGYSFSGYNTTASGSGVTVTSSTVYSADTTVYAQWIADSSGSGTSVLTFIFDEDEQILIETEAEIGGEFGSVTVPDTDDLSEADQTTVGSNHLNQIISDWYCEELGANLSDLLTDGYLIEEDAYTFTAQWADKDSYDPTAYGNSVLAIVVDNTSGKLSIGQNCSIDTDVMGVEIDLSNIGFITEVIGIGLSGGAVLKGFNPSYTLYTGTQNGLNSGNTTSLDDFTIEQDSVGAATIYWDGETNGLEDGEKLLILIAYVLDDMSAAEATIFKNFAANTDYYIYSYPYSAEPDAITLCPTSYNTLPDNVLERYSQDDYTQTTFSAAVTMIVLNNTTITLNSTYTGDLIIFKN